MGGEKYYDLCEQGYTILEIWIDARKYNLAQAKEWMEENGWKCDVVVFSGNSQIFGMGATGAFDCKSTDFNGALPDGITAYIGCHDPEIYHGAYIYIGNIGEEITENDLRELFLRYGAVKSVKINSGYIKPDNTVLNEPHARLQMPRHSEAEIAISALDGYNLKNRELVVKKSSRPQIR